MSLRLPSVQTYPIGPWPGGLNLAVGPQHIDPSETPNARNVTINAAGDLELRGGISEPDAAWHTSTAAITYLYKSTVINGYVVQIGNTLCRKGASIGAAFQTFSTSARCAVVDFVGVLVIVHPVDGVFTYTGSGSPTNRSTTVLGTAVAVWQNKVWVTGISSRVWFSATGDATDWTTALSGAGSVDVREIDDAPCSAIGGGQGMDVTGRPGLLVFKATSSYRINSSVTGAFTTLDTAVGCVGPLALATLNGVTLFASYKGIYATDGVNPPELRSAKVSPMFTYWHLNMAASIFKNVAAGVYQDRVLFSVPFPSGVTVNNATLEVHPDRGWIMVHDVAFTCFAPGLVQGTLFGALPVVDSLGAWRVMDIFTGFGLDYHPGTSQYLNVEGFFETKWYDVEIGYEVQMQRLRLLGRGDVDVAVRRDYQTQGDDYDVDLSDQLTPGNETTLAMYGDAWDLGPCKAVQFTFRGEAVGGDQQVLPAMLEWDGGDEVLLGGFAVNSAVLDYVRLGLA